MPTSITSSGVTFDDATTLTTGVVPTANIADDAVTPAKLSQPLTLATSVATTSGTSIDFTDIPSWVKRITMMLNGVSGSGTSAFLARLGDGGGFETSGYDSFSTSAASTVTTSSNSSGFQVSGGIAARQYRGILQMCLLGVNAWVATGAFNDGAANNIFVSGSKTLSDTLDRIRLTTVNGTDTFDAGSVNIMYEG